MIHSAAIVHPKAKLAKGVSIGPHTIIGENVTIAEETKIGPNCVIDGDTRIGTCCEIFTGAVIGSTSQDRKYKGARAFLEIGDRNIIREYVTINLSTDDKDKTLIGNDNMIMAYTHIAHNCKIGSNATLANACTLAGHVTVEDKAVIGGLVAVHQFVRVGKLSITGGCSKVVQDIAPYSVSDGHPAKVYGINSVGLSRAGISADVKLCLRKAFKILFFMKLNTRTAIEKLRKELPVTEQIEYLINFVTSSERGVAR